VKGAALVTGGAQRIGRAIVERLAREGYAVAIHANWSYGPAIAFRDNIVREGGRAVVVTAELAQMESVSELIDSARSELGPLTLLVNNASEFQADELDTLTSEQWDRQLAVNLRAPVFLARDFARQVPDEADGAVINILDQRVWKPTPHYFSYALSKSALLAATVTMAQALAPRVRVNAIGPGPTLKSARQQESDFLRQTSALPLGRGPAPEEIADAVIYLAGARSVTGQMIAVDGGQHLAWQTPDVLGIRE
jgi:NAD(P)-dependent dehydrogenase (short-subunit alcohol dehydrogenase family)